MTLDNVLSIVDAVSAMQDRDKFIFFLLLNYYEIDY